jgi:hypothetical protein
MKLAVMLVVLVSTTVGGWWLWNYHMPFRNFIADYVENGEFLTLEARYTPQQIMDSHKKELLATDQHTFDEPELKFHPYVLLEVKYTTPDKKSREGMMLWSLVDGEMVLNSDAWDKTHGFEDAIKAKATAQDFKILNALAKNNGSLSRDQMQKELHLEREVFDPWIESARQKHLVTVRGDLIQLHFQDPKILVTPQTKISQWLVTKPYNHAQRVKAKYDPKDIENITRAAFGNDFTIRSSTLVFLPVYSIDVLNPDGSVLTSYWNALNGQRIHPSYAF